MGRLPRRARWQRSAAAAGDGRGQFVGLIFQPDHLEQFHGPVRTLIKRVNVTVIHRSIVFSSSVRVGKSWKNWNTTPMFRPRHKARLLSLIL